MKAQKIATPVSDEFFKPVDFRRSVERYTGAITWKRKKIKVRWMPDAIDNTESFWSG